MFRTDRLANTQASKKHSQSVRLTVEALEGRDVPSSLGLTGPFSWDQSSGQSVALGSATNYTEAGGTVYFSLLFAMVCVYAFWPRNKETFDRAARLPLDED
jgi:cytochrome c oxidase cbb3-type subunit 4